MLPPSTEPFCIVPTVPPNDALPYSAPLLYWATFMLTTGPLPW